MEKNKIHTMLNGDAMKKLIDYYGIGYDNAFDAIYAYKQPHRFYHTWQHIQDLLGQIEAKKLSNNDALFLAAIYHDVVYNPKSQTNEEDSAAMFSKAYNPEVFRNTRIQYSKELHDDVVQIILDTKTHKPQSEESKIFCEMDMDILNRPFGELLDYEDKIFKEFQFVDWKIYQANRIAFLKSCNKENLKPLIDYVENRKPRIAVYPGSFDPFHVGHFNILQKAEKEFDKVIVAKGLNPEKGNSEFVPPAAIQFRQIATYSGLLTDFIKSLDYDVTVVRSLRNTTDAAYEINQYRYLQDLMPEIRVASFFGDREFEHISSSAIRQLIKLGSSVDKYLPK